MPEGLTNSCSIYCNSRDGEYYWWNRIEPYWWFPCPRVSFDQPRSIRVATLATNSAEPKACTDDVGRPADFRLCSYEVGTFTYISEMPGSPENTALTKLLDSVTPGKGMRRIRFTAAEVQHAIPQSSALEHPDGMTASSPCSLFSGQRRSHGKAAFSRPLHQSSRYRALGS